MNFVIFFLVPVAYTYSDILLFIPHLDDTFCVVFFLIYLSKGLSSLIFIFKERTLALLIFSMAFPVVMYGCGSWTIKKAECWRIDAFELCCWRRLLRVSWTASRSNQSILKEIIPEYSLEGLMLKLKLQYSGHLMQTADSLEKTVKQERLKAKEEGGRVWDG